MPTPSLEDLEKELSIEIDKEHAVQQRMEELSDKIRQIKKAKEDKRAVLVARLLPSSHRHDSMKQQFCVGCGIILKEWDIDPGCTANDSDKRAGVKSINAPKSVVAFGGLRCEDCYGTLLNKVLDLLEAEEKKQEKQIDRAADAIHEKVFNT